METVVKVCRNTLNGRVLTSGLHLIDRRFLCQVLHRSLRRVAVTATVPIATGVFRSCLVSSLRYTDPVPCRIASTPDLVTVIRISVDRIRLSLVSQRGGDSVTCKPRVRLNFETQKRYAPPCYVTVLRNIS